MQHDVLAGKFQKLRVKSMSIDTFPIPYWIKEKRGNKFVMIYLNDAYEDAYLKPNNLTREDYLNKMDIEVWSKDVALAFYKNDIECYNRKGWTEFYEWVNIGGEKIRRKFVKQYVSQSGAEYVAGMSVDFLDPEFN